MQIRVAVEADLSAIQSLLRANNLPVADISKALIGGFLVAEGASGSVIGIGRLEQFGSGVLLRSLAVAPGARGIGIARALVARLEDNARSCGRQDVWLLTMTGERFFERAGYLLVNREVVPSEVRLSEQFASLCPSTASCMRKRLRTSSSARSSLSPGGRARPKDVVSYNSAQRSAFCHPGVPPTRSLGPFSMKSSSKLCPTNRS